MELMDSRGDLTKQFNALFANFLKEVIENAVASSFITLLRD